MLARRIADKRSSTIAAQGSGGKEIDDLLNGFVGALVGGFEIAGRLVLGVGAVGAGRDKDSRGYVLADLSGHHTPIEWARIAVAAYKSHGADRIVAEVNNGGEMVEATLRGGDDNVAYTPGHAPRGKG